MTAGLGIAVGTATSGTALVPAGGPASDEPVVVTSARSTVLQVAADGSVGLAERSTDPADTPVSGFVERVGDPVGLLDDGGRVHLGEDLFATTVTELIATATSGTPAGVVVTHPTAWNRYTVAALESALARHGLPEARLVPEATACVRWLESSRGRLDDGVVVVYDLGASALDVTVVRTGAAPAVLGKPLRSEEFGGAHIDHLVTRHVLDTLAGKTDGLDPFDAATTAALGELRRRCAAAKESLSADTETVVAVALPGVETDVRLVRSELEDLIRQPLSHSLELVREALRSAEIEVSDVSHVLLAGGGGSIPLVAELVSSELGLTVVTAPDPALTAAVGAAHLAWDRTPAAAAPTAAATVFPDEVATHGGHVLTEPVVASFPSRLRSARAGWSARRRVAIVMSAAVAVGVLTAGGLAVGTGTDPVPARSSSPASSSAPSHPGSAPTVDAVAGRPGDDPAAVTVGGGTGPTTASIVGASAGAATTVGTAAATGGGTRDAGRATAADAAAPAPGTVTPAAPAPASPLPQPNPAPPQGGGYTPPPGPDLGRIGAGVGQAATGIGNGVGGVVDGLGGVVGAVVDPVTGLLVGK